MDLLYIEITDKYYIENKIAWYTDKFGARYYRDDILYIIKTGKLPRECYEYFGIRRNSKSEINYKVIINMSFVRGRLRCKNKLRSSKVYSKDKICVITEDSNSGYILVYNLLNRCYPDIRFDIISAGGKDNIYTYLDKYMNKYKYYVVVVDDKKSDYKLISSIIERKRLFNKLGLRLSIFKPLSIEECLLSWRELQLKSRITSNVHDELIMYRDNGVKPYTYISGDDYLYGGKIIKNLELELFKCTNNISTFLYTKQRVAYCIFINCCIRYIVDKTKRISSFKDKCKKCKLINKIYSLMSDSLFAGLAIIIDTYTYGYIDRFPNWSESQKSSLYIM